MTNIEILVYPDDKHILSATATDALLLGAALLHLHDAQTELPPCVLRVPRQMYFAALSAWLDEKAGYYTRTGGSYAGVGHIVFEGDLTEKDGAWLDNAGANLGSNRLQVDLYTAKSFEIDMEHG